MIGDSGSSIRRMNFIQAMALTLQNVSVAHFRFVCSLNVHPAKPIASIGTGSLGGYWVRRYTRESWWTLRSQASSSLRSAFRSFHHRTPTLTTTSSAAVVRKTEFPGRPRFSRSGLIPRPHIPEALPWKSRRPLPQFHHRRRG